MVTKVSKTRSALNTVSEKLIMLQQKFQQYWIKQVWSRIPQPVRKKWVKIEPIVKYSIIAIMVAWSAFSAIIIFYEIVLQWLQK